MLRAEAAEAAAAGRYPDALERFDRILALYPSDAPAWHDSALIAAHLDDPSAYARIASACRLESQNIAFAKLRREIASKVVPPWHFSMMNHGARNLAYADAIARNVKPGQVVLDIGTGSGLLAMLAAKAGAKHVFTCEMNPAVAAIAKDIIAANGFAGRITVVPKSSFEISVGADLPAHADLLVTETFASNVIDENILGIVADARARLLTPAALVIPTRAVVCGALVASPILEKRVRTEHVCGFDLSAMNAFSPLNLPVSPLPSDVKWLSEPTDLISFNLAGGQEPLVGAVHAQIEVTAEGRCVGVLHWIRLDLDDDMAFENFPEGERDPPAHWLPGVFTFPQPVAVNPSQSVKLDMAYAHQTLNAHFAAVTGAKGVYGV